MRSVGARESSKSDCKVPKRLTIADELPLLPIGKVDKRRLRNRVLEV